MSQLRKTLTTLMAVLAIAGGPLARPAAAEPPRKIICVTLDLYQSPPPKTQCLPNVEPQHPVFAHITLTIRNVSAQWGSYSAELESDLTWETLLDAGVSGYHEGEEFGVLFLHTATGDGPSDWMRLCYRTNLGAFPSLPIVEWLQPVDGSYCDPPQ